VKANPEGLLVDLRTGRRHPWLFWEGSSYCFPTLTRGYVVQPYEVKGLFRSVLPRLGLQGREIDDFVRIWAPRFTEFPYYFIGFHDQSAVDLLAPLHISPEPDVLIRVCMDYRGLDEFTQVEEPELPPTPRRHGLTVVEWGGLK
jgi:hypothetical protein